MELYQTVLGFARTFFFPFIISLLYSVKPNENINGIDDIKEQL